MQKQSAKGILGMHTLKSSVKKASVPTFMMLKLKIVLKKWKQNKHFRAKQANKCSKKKTTAGLLNRPKKCLSVIAGFNLYIYNMTRKAKSRCLKYLKHELCDLWAANHLIPCWAGRWAWCASQKVCPLKDTYYTIWMTKSLFCLFVCLAANTQWSSTI